MKSIIFALIITLSSLQAFSVSSLFNNLTNKSESKVNISSTLAKKYINKKNCDQILFNNGFFTTCYDYNHKGLIYGYAKINGDKVNELNIKKRPKFYDDKNIPKKYRTYYKDYTHSGYDRGHTIASDASFDFSLKSQKSTYSMGANILPMRPNTNRKSYLSVEKYERLIAKKLNSVEVLTIVDYPKHPKRIGRNKLSVPSGFGKMFWNNDKKFQKCFYIPNDNVSYDLRKLEINCKDLLK